jgi:hypothetical protein
MLQVLMEMDGKKNLAAVADNLNMDMAILRKIVAKLHKFKLIGRIEKTAPVLEEKFLDFITDRLSQAMGPIAEILIEDEIEDMGLTRNNVPKHRVAELIGLLARQIPRESKRVVFQKAMLEKIKGIKS